ncbi:xanthine dehydrogenase family protein molybdopterin-binding subunit [Vreelandella maris]|uniref:Molybdopterin-dependent oxidoreductase n=1 Tax=Vreelandella maris TaxID=2729617 RepID=A0A7Y6VAI8_9GAMM|nr:molybdopterin cofactor-binding domain-containing protein [Halomonas maris]NVF16529.1 molybdopterin-dependent oxidoreductase [Halomonas maris]|tara:strand:- start:14247 stop:17222 length:2976 start_codon:yes stop_codon:yes gene_type:complete
MYMQKSIAEATVGHIGSRQARVEDAALLQGQGRYADDMATPPGTLQAAVVRSPHAHARIRSVDASRALTMKGVHGVLTGDDVKRWSNPFPVGVRAPMEHWPLAVDKVRYVGEPVCVVIADDRYLAEDALDAVQVEYEPLTPIIDPEAATLNDAPILHEGVGSNVVNERNFRYGDPERAFAEAPHRITLKVQYPRNSCTPIECYVVLAQYLPASETYDVMANFQGPYALHSVMCRALNVPANRLRLRTPPDSGGSFGIKQGVFPYVVLMGLASRKVGAPVKWVEDRLEHLQASSSATNRVCEIEAAVEANGRVTALRYDQIDDCGAYLRAPEPATFYRMHGNLSGAYTIRNLAVRNRVVLTNKMPTGLNRGFGGGQVYFALERLMQHVAAELGLDPLEVIQRNLVPAGVFPYRAAAGALLDSGDYPAAVELARRKGNLDELLQRRDQARAEGRLYGIGYAAVVEPSISNMGYITVAMTPEERQKAGPKNGAVSTATVSVDPLGSVTAHVSSTPQGQGHQTVVAQIISELLGVKLESISVNVELDTGKDAWSIASGNYSSRFSGAVAGSVYNATLKIRERMATIAADMWQVSSTDVRFADGKIFVENGPSQPFHRVAGTTHWSPGLLPEGETGGLRETAFWTPPQLEAPNDQDCINSSLCYGFILDFCGVEIDRVTGQVRIDKYVTTHDAGRILNPMLVEGQILGAYSQALGVALMEEFAYGEDGSFLSGTLADYLIPTAPEVVDPVILHMETPSPFTPLGAKGVGEGNNMSTPVCIANAVADALGRSDIKLPLTPSRVRSMIGIDEPAAPEGLVMDAPKVAGGSALQANDLVEIPAPPQQVFDAILDPETLKAIIPGCHALELESENHYRADVTVGVGMIRARFAARVALTDLDPPHSLRLSGSGNSPMGSATGSAKINLVALENGNTRLEYAYEAAVTGKVAAVGGRMLQSASRVIIGQIFTRLAQRLSGKPIDTSLWQRLRALLGMGGTK